MANSTFPLPTPFDFTHPEDWVRWIKRFERYREATGLDKKEGPTQVSTLVYAMGEKAEDVLTLLALSGEEMKSYSEVKVKFESHFVKKRNIIYERARFNQRSQGEGEPVDAFITSLYTLAEHCQFGVLHDDLIRDRIVVGLRDLKLSERLQLDHELTLEKAVVSARQSEAVKQQQKTLRSHFSEEPTGGTLGKDVSAVEKGKKKPTETRTTTSFKETCGRCGRTPGHNRANCPAREAKCSKCQKIGHYGAQCRSKFVSEVVSDTDNTENGVFLRALTAPGSSSPWMVSLLIKNTPVQFKIDTGADVSVIPAKLFSRFNKQWNTTLTAPDRNLHGPNKNLLDVTGYFVCRLQKGECSVEDKVYVVENLSNPLLGRPAIEKLNLLSRIESVRSDKLVPSIVTEYSDVFQGLGSLHDEYHICLKENSKPFALSTPRRIAIPLLPKVKEELSRMEALDVISKVEGPTDWCAPMVVVPKPNGTVRICVDLTKLNQSVRRERHILPSVEDTLAQLGNAQVFTKLDANSGFWQVRLSKASSPLTTFITPFGRYCFHRLPFGITSAPEHFQKRMSQILEGLEGVVCMVDDILVFGVNQEQHDQRLRQVLTKLRAAGVTLNKQKCVFSVPSVKFIGQIVSQGGIQPDPEKVSAITEMATPKNVAELRRFLGLVNHQAKYVKDLSEITEPLRALLQQKSHWHWGGPQNEAFERIKRKITTVPVLALYHPNQATILSADASSYGLGAVLQQQQSDGKYKAIAYASRSMSETERRYAQIEKEALAVTWASERFQHYLIGRDFTIETDHKPLVPLLGSKGLDDLPPRIQRFRMRLFRFSFSIRHIPGKELVTADALSRQPILTPSKVDQIVEEEVEHFTSLFSETLPASEKRLEEIKVLQNEDTASSQTKTYVTTEWPKSHLLQGESRLYWNLRNELHIHDGLLLRGSRIVIPPTMRAEVLHTLHGSHQGVSKCRERAKQAVWWPGISTQIEALVANCVTCARERRNPAEPLVYTPFPAYPWQKVAMDLFEWRGRPYLLVIDYYSRYVEIALLSSTTSPAVINHLRSIFARHGFPEIVVSDNGPQFSSEAFRQFGKECQFSHVTSSPGFPQANGEAERAVQTIKSLLQKRDDPYMALLSYRSTPLHNGFSPAELLMSRKLRTNVPMIPDQLRPRVPDLSALRNTEERAKNKMKQDFDKHHKAKDLAVLLPGTKVWVPDQRQYGTVVASASPRSYIVTTPQKQVRRNRRSLRPITLEEGASQTSTEQSQDVTKESQVPCEDQPVSRSSVPVQQGAETSEKPDCSVRVHEPRTSIMDSPVITSSGRVSRPPQRLDL